MGFDDINTLEELRERLRSNSLLLVDSQYSQVMVDLKERFGAVGFHLNRWWVMTPADWECPACGRLKPELVRLDKHRRLMGQLHEHHDHMVDLVLERFRHFSVRKETVVADEQAEKFAIRTAFGLSAYDNTVVCADCNHADGKAKQAVGTHKDFSFSPAEIRRIVKPKPNIGPHEIDVAVAKLIWNEGKAVFSKRMHMVDLVAELAASDSHWYQASPFSAKRTERAAKNVFAYSGLSELARRLGETPEALLYDAKPRKGNLTSWRQKRARKSTKVPTENDIQFMRRTRGKFWNRLDDNWRCECCRRSKLHCTRPSDGAPWVFEVKEKQLYSPERECLYEYVKLCEDCSNVARHLAREVLDTAGTDLRDPSVIIALADLRSIIIPRPHMPHDVDGQRVDAVLPMLTERIGEFHELRTS